MSASQLYFNLLPSDLCAASNFRHVFILFACSETLLSSASAGLALTLSVAMYTHQSFIRLHTGFHPFLQASILMVSAVSLLFKTLFLVALVTAIMLNDGEIFVACAQEDVEQLMQNVEADEKKEGAKPTEGGPKARPPIPGPYSCGSGNNCLYRAASTIALVSHAYTRPLQNPTEVARRCFKRRQACLLRLRHMITCYPVFQLLFGIVSITFWFSSTDSHSEVARQLLSSSQHPSLRLFDSYLILWTVDMLHTPLFLLIATWHYARVDWQMQVLAVYHVLNVSGGGHAAETGKRHDRRPTSRTEMDPCPTCQQRMRKRTQRKKDRVRDSSMLRRALAKEERRHANAMDDLTANRSAFEARQGHRVAALASLLRTQHADPGLTGGEDVHRHRPPFNMPVSPTSLSFILGGSSAADDSSSIINREPGSPSSGSSASNRLNSCLVEPARPASALLAPPRQTIRSCLHGDRRRHTTIGKEKHVTFPASLIGRQGCRDSNHALSPTGSDGVEGRTSTSCSIMRPQSAHLPLHSGKRNTGGEQTADYSSFRICINADRSSSMGCEEVNGSMPEANEAEK